MRHFPALLPILLLAFPCLAAATPGAGWRNGWGLADTARPAQQGQGGAFATLALQPRSGGHAAIARNLLAGPVQVRLRGQAGPAQELALAPVLLQPGEQRRLLWLPAGRDARQLLLDAYPGDPAAHAHDFLYQLPFRAKRVRVSQAFAGRYSHTDAQNRYAIDFPLAEGTAVLAARAGRVMQVVDGDPELGSLIRLLHADGSMAVYAHLQAGSLRVRPGQAVEAGQVLAASGNTGRSSGPHLHFAVQINTGLALASIPFRMADGRGELHFPRDDTP